MTQLDHALQTMELAKNYDETNKFQLTCFLHDIGHFLLDEDNSQEKFLEKDLEHEKVGYNYISRFFDSDITTPILFHVSAKRYLCTVNSLYYDTLSESSKRSFALQGGNLDKDVIKTLKQHSGFRKAIKLRQYEDESKNINNKELTVDLDYARDLIYDYVKFRN